MRSSDVVIKGFVSADRQEDFIGLFGKLEWHLNYHPIKEDAKFNQVDMDVNKHAWATVVFEGLPCADLLEVYRLIVKATRPLRYSDHHNAVKIPGIRIRVNDDMTYDLFMRAMRQLFILASAEIPESCLKSANVVVDDKFYPAE